MAEKIRQYNASFFVCVREEVSLGALIAIAFALSVDVGARGLGEDPSAECHLRLPGVNRAPAQSTQQKGQLSQHVHATTQCSKGGGMRSVS